MFTQKLFKKTCLLFNLIRCLKNHLHFNVFEIYQKSKKDFKKREKFLDWAQCKKIVFKANFFNPVLCSFFIILDVFSPLFIYQWTAGEISDQKIPSHPPPCGGKIITLENSFLTPCFLLLHNRHYYSIKNAALLHGQEAQISL